MQAFCGQSLSAWGCVIKNNKISGIHGIFHNKSKEILKCKKLVIDLSFTLKAFGPVVTAANGVAHDSFLYFLLLFLANDSL